MVSRDRRILNAGIGALAFVLTCAGLNTFLSAPEIDRVVPTVGFFKEHRDDFDTVFIGSSHVRHQIAPAVFDRTMRAAGYPTHTFNLGVNGMFPPENFYVVDEVLKAKPRNLKWVFVELGELETERSPGTEGTPRAFYWRDWKRTALLLRAILAGDSDLGSRLTASERLNLLFYHSVLFVKNFANVGQQSDLARWVRPLWKKKRKPAKDLGPSDDGYTPLNKEPAAEATSDKGGPPHLGGTEARYLSTVAASAYRQLADDVRRLGAVPIFLVTPNAGQTQLGFPPQSGVAATVMSFNNAKDYPELYWKEMRFDSDHLNGPASENFTRLLAEDFWQRVQQHEIR